MACFVPRRLEIPAPHCRKKISPNRTFEVPIPIVRKRLSPSRRIANAPAIDVSLRPWDTAPAHSRYNHEDLWGVMSLSAACGAFSECRTICTEPSRRRDVAHDSVLPGCALTAIVPFTSSVIPLDADRSLRQWRRGFTRPEGVPEPYPKPFAFHQKSDQTPPKSRNAVFRVS